MNVRVITVTRGQSPYWCATAASVAAAAPTAEHVVVCPREQIPAVKVARPDIFAIQERTPGLYPNLNRGLHEITSDWGAFTWINDDDLLRGPGFERLVAELERRPEIDIAFGRVEAIDGRGMRVGALPVTRRGDDLGALFARGIMPLAQPGTLIRRRVWERVGDFDESYSLAGDLDFFVRAVQAGARFGFVAADVAAFRLTAGQLSKRREDAILETTRALRPCAGLVRNHAALLRFRLANLAVYWERIRRHGLKSMRELYDHVE